MSARFDFLHSARPMLVQRLVEIRLPERFHNALLALTGSLIVMAGAWSIDAYRLHEARRIEAVYRQRFDQADETLKQTDVYYERVKAIVDLDRRVHEIAESGDADARTLAEIANRVPAHAWLTAISHDGEGLALDGHAKDLSVISSVIRGLMRAKHLHGPMLVNATADKEHGHDAGMKYEIRIGGTAP